MTILPWILCAFLVLIAWGSAINEARAVRARNENADDIDDLLDERQKLTTMLKRTTAALHETTATLAQVDQMSRHLSIALQHEMNGDHQTAMAVLGEIAHIEREPN